MDMNVQKFADLIKEFKSVYGAGGIQNRSRPDGWRQDLTEFFSKNEIKFVNPVADNKAIFNFSIMGFKEDGSTNTLDDLLQTDELKRARLFKQTEENDMHFMKNVDLQLFYLDKSAGFGTFTEFCKNFDEFKKPFIIVRNIARNDLPHWVEWRRLEALWVYNTAIEFKNLTEVKQFFVDYLGFKE